MNRSLHTGVKKMILVIAVAVTVIFSTAVAQAWWGREPAVEGHDGLSCLLSEYRSLRTKALGFTTAVPSQGDANVGLSLLRQAGVGHRFYYP
jgi:hypothetical protein